MPHRLKMIDWRVDKGKYELQDTEEILDIIMVTDDLVKIVIKEWYKG